MAAPLIIASKTDLALRPAPIEPSWIISGNPVATNAPLSTSADGMSTTVVWECTEGQFEWHYDFDETIHFLEGAVLIEGDGLPPTRFLPGDVLFFKKGAVARWTVESKVRKLAFCRKTVPALLGLSLRVFNKLYRVLFARGARSGSSLVQPS